MTRTPSIPGHTDQVGQAPSLQMHPQPDEHGKPVIIRRPSAPSALSAWMDPSRIAAVVPGGGMPPALNGIAIQAWSDPPTDANGWEALAQRSLVAEPAFAASKGLAAAAGVVIRESDGRIWMVCPTNQFAGYAVTFPKGRTDGKSLQAAALTEAFEESGLRVRLLRHLIDVRRTQTYTRYYLAERVGGTPSAMGWESQCVLLASLDQVKAWKLASPDLVVLHALESQ